MDEPATFGEWVGRRRRALHVTQEALAEQLYCALGTLRKIESDERRPSRELAERLAEVLQVPSEHQAMFVSVARAELALARLVIPPDPAATPRRPEPTQPPTNLRLPRTSFIGRDAERAQVQALLLREDVGLVTLTGPGGTGKTRLALEVAAALRDHFADGVWFVDLASLTDPGMVAPAIAQALGVREAAGQSIIDSLTSHLRDRHILLVLDNFEQVVDAAPEVSTLLVTARQLTVLVTSRVVLHLSGEHEYTVPPLILPSYTQPLEPEQVTASEAVRLFIARAQSVNAGFTVTPENAGVVAEICYRMDGLPLAIELAAARIKLFSLQTLLERLGNRLAFLTGGARDLPYRHQTIRNTIDWSYRLLEPAEQELFTHLAVFLGGCTLPAAEAVCGGDHGLDVHEGLASLLDKSLVQPMIGLADELRFTMLETIREYAHEHLRANGDLEMLRHNHAHYYRSVVEMAPTSHDPTEWAAWLERIKAEHDNVRGALRWWLAQNDLLPGFHMVNTLWQFWYVHGHVSEAVSWFDQALRRETNDTQPSTMTQERLHLRSDAMHRRGRLALFQGDFEGARQWLETSLSLSTQLGDRRAMHTSLLILGDIALTQGDYGRAKDLYADVLTFARATEDLDLMAGTLNRLGETARLQGDDAQAARLYDEALTLFNAQKNQDETALVSTNLGYMAVRGNDPERARTLFSQSLAYACRIGHKPITVNCLAGLAGVAVASGHIERATRLLGATKQVSEDTGIHLDRPDQIDFEHWLAIAHGQLGTVAFNTAWAEGQAMTLEEVVAYALEEISNT